MVENNTLYICTTYFYAHLLFHCAYIYTEKSQVHFFSRHCNGRRYQVGLRSPHVHVEAQRDEKNQPPGINAVSPPPNDNTQLVAVVVQT